MFLPFSILFSNFAVFHAIPLKLYTIQTEDASCAPNPGITKTDLSSVKILWPRPCQSHAKRTLGSGDRSASIAWGAERPGVARGAMRMSETALYIARRAFSTKCFGGAPAKGALTKCDVFACMLCSFTRIVLIT